ncbi:MAG: PilZ domain-containing protein [Polyangia bacterium]
MEPFIVKNQRKSPRIAVYLPATAVYGGHHIDVRIENISRDGLYLFSPVLMKVRAVFDLTVFMPDSDEPVRMFVAACFAEQTLAGFGVGVYISGISTDSRVRWEAYFEQRLRLQPRASESSGLSRLPRPKVLMFDRVLPSPTVQALIEQGLAVYRPADEVLGMEDGSAASADLVIAELSAPRLAALNAWRSPRRPPVVLLTSRGAMQDFLAGMEVGAARVIVKPCSRDLLIAQIMQTLSSHLGGAKERSGVEPTDVFSTEDALSNGPRSARPDRAGGVRKTLRAAWRWMTGSELAQPSTSQGAT